MQLCELFPVFTEKYCTENRIEKLPGPRDWVQILQDQIKLARRRLKRGIDMEPSSISSICTLHLMSFFYPLKYLVLHKRFCESKF